jgi:hypothetical protein
MQSLVMLALLALPFILLGAIVATLVVRIGSETARK